MYGSAPAGAAGPAKRAPGRSRFQTKERETLIFQGRVGVIPPGVGGTGRFGFSATRGARTERRIQIAAKIHFQAGKHLKSEMRF